MTVEDSIRRAWADLKREVGVGELDNADRCRIEDLLPPLHDDRDPVFVEEFTEALDKAAQLVKVVDEIRRDKGAALTRSKRGRRSATTDPVPLKLDKRFERRLYIVRFVLFEIHTTRSLFVPIIMGSDVNNGRINWRDMQRKWNAEHPSDLMSSPDVFRTTFYRILRENPDAVRELVRREISDIVGIAVKARGGSGAGLPADHDVLEIARGILERQAKGGTDEHGNET